MEDLILFESLKVYEKGWQFSHRKRGSFVGLEKSVREGLIENI